MFNNLVTTLREVRHVSYVYVWEWDNEERKGCYGCNKGSKSRWEYLNCSAVTL